MKQVNNGYADYYYLSEDGKVFNANTKKYLRADRKYVYRLQTVDKKRKNVSLKKLYKLVFDKVYCVDAIESVENEVWREIAETEGNYLVSNKGRVKSYSKYNAILMVPQLNKRNYGRLQIIQNGIMLNKYVHVLVASAFPEVCGRPLNIEYQVHHKDNNNLNNCSDNLIWVSKAEHIKIHNTTITKN